MKITTVIKKISVKLIVVSLVFGFILYLIFYEESHNALINIALALGFLYLLPASIIFVVLYEILVASKKPVFFSNLVASGTALCVPLILGAAFLGWLNHDAEPLNFKRLHATPGAVDESYQFMLEVPADEGNEPFNKHNWLHGTDALRAKEIKKLIKQGLLEDKSTEELKQLLGFGEEQTPCFFSEATVHCNFRSGGLLSPYWVLVVNLGGNAPRKIHFTRW